MIIKKTARLYWAMALALGLASIPCASPMVSTAQTGVQPRPDPAWIRDISADAFVESEGINTQFSRPTYDRDARLPQFLKKLGIRHVRDGIQLRSAAYIATLNTIAQEAGVKYDLITDGGANAFGSNAQSSEQIAAFVSSIPSAEAVEAPNEYDTRCCAWKQALLPFLGQLRKANTGLTIVGPAFTSSYAYDLVGNITPLIDATNIHNYYAGFNPETKGWGGVVQVCGVSHRESCGRYGSLQYARSLGALSGPTLPVFSTENGYGTGGEKNVVDRVTQAKYLPRLLFYQFLAGIKRTYIFQLVDYSGKSGYHSFGLLDSSADYSTHSAKPAFNVISAINTLLTDPGPPFDLTPTSISLTGQTANVQTVLMQKRDGTVWLAIWLGVSSYDVNGQPPADIRVRPQLVLVGLRDVFEATSFAFDDDGLKHVKKYARGNAFPIEVSDSVTLVEISDPRKRPVSTIDRRRRSLSSSSFETSKVEDAAF